MKQLHSRSIILAGLMLAPFSLGLAQADAVFPLSSGRPQRDGNCWAYGATQMLEARTESRDKVSAMTDIEKSYRYYLVYDRLLNSYHRKLADEGDGSGDGVNDIGGYAADLFNIYSKHGFEFLSVKKTSGISDFAYPKTRNYTNSFQADSNADGFHDKDLVLSTEKQLMQGNLSEAQAIDLIQKNLAKAFRMENPLLATTSWLDGKKIQVSSTYNQMLGADTQTATHSVVYLTTTSETVPNKKWLRYDSGKYLGVAFKDKKAILTLMRASMDRGWPTTIESKDHVMTALGYKTTSAGQYVYAVSDSSGAYNPHGISWQPERSVLNWFTDSTVYFDAVKDLLPAQDVNAKLPLVKLPRKH